MGRTIQVGPDETDRLVRAITEAGESLADSITKAGVSIAAAVLLVGSMTDDEKKVLRSGAGTIPLYNRLKSIRSELMRK